MDFIVKLAAGFMNLYTLGGQKFLIMDCLLYT